MKKSLLFGVLTLCISCSLHAKTNFRNDSLKLDSLMSIYEKNYNFNGVAFVAYKDHILLDNGYGYLDHSKKIKNSSECIFQMGSNTKQFTAELILILASKHLLSLQDPIARYFPGYPHGDEITIEHLLTHASGIHNYTEDSIMQQTPAKVMTREQLIGLFRDAPLEFTPGSKFKYSNSNYVLLGCIIEKVTGESYESVMRRLVLAPAGMNHSGFDFTHLADAAKTTGYMSIDRGNYVVSPIVDSTLSYAAGSLYSTANDMYKWHKALKNYTLIDKEWQEKGFTPHISGYGYGWFIDSLFNVKVEGHPGGIHGFYTYFMRSQEDDLCIILLQNVFHSEADNNEIAVNIMRAIYGTTFAVSGVNSKKLPKTKYVAVDEEKLKLLTGTYDIAPTFKLVVSLNDGLLSVQASGQPELKLHPESETLFFLEEANAQVEFVKNDKGSVNKLILHQSGQVIPAMKENN